MSVWLCVGCLCTSALGCRENTFAVAEEAIDTSTQRDSPSHGDASTSTEPVDVHPEADAVELSADARDEEVSDGTGGDIAELPDLGDRPVDSSEIRLVDVTDVTTNTYRINRNTASLTRPGHTVEISLALADPAVTITWSASDGALSATADSAVRWTAPLVGQDETIITRIEAMVEGGGSDERHTLDIVTYQARTLSFEHGDSHLAWTQIVYPEPNGHRHVLFTYARDTNRLFDHGASVGYQHGRRALVGDTLWYQSTIGPPEVSKRHVETGVEEAMDLGPLLSAWDMRGLRATSTHLAWQQASNSYEAVALYYRALREPDPTNHLLPTSESVYQPVVMDDEHLYYTLPDQSAYPQMTRTYRVRLEDGFVTELVGAPADVRYLLQIEDGRLLYLAAGHAVFDTQTGTTRVLEGVAAAPLAARLIDGVLWVVNPSPESGSSPATIESIATSVRKLDVASGHQESYDIGSFGPRTNGLAELCWVDTRWSTPRWGHGDAELYCLDVR